MGGGPDVHSAWLGKLMWNREEASKPAPPVQPTQASGAATAPKSTRSSEREPGNIGKSVVIKGELSGSEDLTIEGQVEGSIELEQHVLTIGPNARIRAEVSAKAVVVLGEVMGDIKATERVAIRDSGTVSGDIVAPKVAIAEGASFRGGIDMQVTVAAPSGPGEVTELSPQGQEVRSSSQRLQAEAAAQTETGRSPAASRH